MAPNWRNKIRNKIHVPFLLNIENTSRAFSDSAKATVSVKFSKEQFWRPPASVIFAVDLVEETPSRRAQDTHLFDVYCKI